MANIYRANFRSASPRISGKVHSFQFGAADDDAALAIWTVLSTYTKAQLVSVTKQISTHNLGANHPAGTLLSMRAYCIDSDKTVVRYNARNLKSTTLEQDIVALFTGAAAANTNPVTALSAPPAVPFAPHDAFSVVNVLITNRA